MSELDGIGESIRCPMLGHQVPFEYCTQCDDSFPCRKIIDCWSMSMDVHGRLKERYSPEQIGRILSPPKPKILQIIEAARKASLRNPQ